MMRKYQVRFGGGLLEKGQYCYLASFLPYFLGINDRYLKQDLEDAILREMEHFLLELGGGFAFRDRQKRIQIGNDDFCPNRG